VTVSAANQSLIAHGLRFHRDQHGTVALDP
jgi:hypothetical protein